VSESLRLGARQTITYESLVVSDEYDLVLQYAARNLQARVGEGLVDTIWRAGGTATVALRFNTWDDPAMYVRNLELQAGVTPAKSLNVPVVVPHYVYFPADWYCVYCGTLNDGLKHPRTCAGCQGPKSLNSEVGQWRNL